MYMSYVRECAYMCVMHTFLFHHNSLSMWAITVPKCTVAEEGTHFVLRLEEMRGKISAAYSLDEDS